MCCFLGADYLASSAAGILGNFTEFEKLFVRHFLYEFLKSSKTLHIAALDTSVVADATDTRNDAGTLYSLSKAANNVGAALVIVFFYLDIGSHK